MRFGLREFIFMVVLLAVPIASFWFVFKPRNADIEQARKEIAAKQQTLDKLAESSKQIGDMRRAIEEGRDAIDIIEAKLPAEQAVDEVLRQASDLAVQHNLHVKAVTPEKKVPASQYMELPILWELTGNFDGFYEFLLDLEQMPRLTQIRNMNIKRSDQQNGAMSATFTLSIYFRPRTDDSTLAGVQP
jgi:Tfp pilus assembly protein PilO